MANHGYVKTRKVMTVEAINQLLDELNKNHFKNGLKIEYHKGDEHSWGPHVWMLTYPSKDHDGDWGSRVCWLNTSRSFEMRHGGGSDFIWWIDSLILATLADRFNGKVSDDGVGGSWPGEAQNIDTFKKYNDRRLAHVKDPKIKKFILQSTLEITPPEFRGELNEQKRRPSKSQIKINKRANKKNATKATSRR